MDRFVSNFTNKLDAKGRVSIPASFRAVVARDGFEGLYVHPSLDLPTLDCGGQALLNQIDAMIEPLSPFSADRDAIAMTLLGESDILKIDAEGRISLTEALKEHAGITTEVTFVGAGQKFQIWEPNSFRTRLLEARQQTRALRQQYGSRPATMDGPSSSPPGARE
ncbi:division/cell wall cluster transcriptional repressor MraZ [Lichenihabitans psoromatis]|uniref:division/cell wall cluster transcriptional repressor MraZ n=1 Tax=Lichenihabitans psoromatis TaxID=2528642 RepID=UPI001035C1F2|nr:division/cell wall cluster transcriptional repressor MraZ [Lichenihabitans psoromatis]